MAGRRRDERTADPAGGARKARDAAMALPIVGTLLFLPPVAQVFAVEGRILGIPVTVFFIFAVWAGLILGAWWTGGRILATEAPAEDGEPRDAGAAAPPAPPPAPPGPADRC